MTHSSIFSGLGGFDKAARDAGMKNLWACEKEPFCRKVLAKNFTDITIYEDVTRTDWTAVESPDILSAGFPCQPFSLAGQRAGAEDDRYLWPALLEAIQILDPAWVLGENVPGIISMALDTVLADLEDAGYTCWTFVVPACAVGALHRRDRTWILANTVRSGRKELDTSALTGSEAQRPVWHHSEFPSAPWDGAGHTLKSAILRMANGLSLGLDPRSRNARIRALGNAIVPQVAERFFRMILAAESQTI